MHHHYARVCLIRHRYFFSYIANLVNEPDLDIAQVTDCDMHIYSSRSSGNQHIGMVPMRGIGTMHIMRLRIESSNVIYTASTTLQAAYRPLHAPTSMPTEPPS